MNILYLTNRLPYPLHSGYLRQYYFIRELSKAHRVTLISVVPRNCPAAHIQAVAEIAERVITVNSGSWSNHPLSKRWRRLSSTFRADRVASKLHAVIDDLVRREKYDVAVMHGLSTASVLPQFRGMRVLADLCDANSCRFLAATRHIHPFRLPATLWDYATARRLEGQFIRSRAHLVFATIRDQQALLRNTSRPGTVVPNGVDLDFWNRDSPELGVNTIVFTGALSYPPNVDAALHLIETIFPLVRKEVPQAQLQVIGRDPPQRLIRAAQQANVLLTGEVEDVRPYLEQAAVFAAPLRYGMGMQNKILQALAMQVPIVASQSAVEGLSIADGSFPPVDIVTHDRGFAEKVCRRLTMGATDRAPCFAGRQFVERHFRWSQSGRLLNQLIHSI